VIQIYEILYPILAHTERIFNMINHKSSKSADEVLVYANS